MSPVPNTRTRSNHSLSIRAKGVTVGLVQTWSYDLTRKITPVYELNPITSGEPVDNVPGNIEGLNITVSRVDLYNKKMEEAFGTSDLSMLSKQNDPFEIMEQWTNPDGTSERYSYEGCWFSKISRRNEVGGDRRVVAEGTLVYLRRVKI